MKFTILLTTITTLTLAAPSPLTKPCTPNSNYCASSPSPCCNGACDPLSGLCTEDKMLARRCISNGAYCGDDPAGCCSGACDSLSGLCTAH